MGKIGLLIFGSDFQNVRYPIKMSIAPYSDSNIKTISYGSQKMGINTNVAIIDAVHNLTMKK